TVDVVDVDVGPQGAAGWLDEPVHRQRYLVADVDSRGETVRVLGLVRQAIQGVVESHQIEVSPDQGIREEIAVDQGGVQTDERHLPLGTEASGRGVDGDGHAWVKFEKAGAFRVLVPRRRILRL